MSNSEQPEPLYSEPIIPGLTWGNIEEYRPILEEVLVRNPAVMHFMIEDNVSACMRGGERTLTDVWGHYHFKDKSLVGCQLCLEWIHA